MFPSSPNIYTKAAWIPTIGIVSFLEAMSLRMEIAGFQACLAPSYKYPRDRGKSIGRLAD